MKKHYLKGKCLFLFILGSCVWVPGCQSHRPTGLFPFLKHVFIMLAFLPLSYEKVKFKGWRNKTSACNPEYHVAILLTLKVFGCIGLKHFCRSGCFLLPHIHISSWRSCKASDVQGVWNNSWVHLLVSAEMWTNSLTFPPAGWKK